MEEQPPRFKSHIAPVHLNVYPVANGVELCSRFLLFLSNWLVLLIVVRRNVRVIDLFSLP